LPGGFSEKLVKWAVILESYYFSRGKREKAGNGDNIHEAIREVLPVLIRMWKTIPGENNSSSPLFLSCGLPGQVVY